MRRGKFEYSFDLPDEAEVYTAIPQVRSENISSNVVEEVRERTRGTDAVVVDYLPLRAYADLISQLETRPILLSTWRVGEVMGDVIIRDFSDREGVHLVDDFVKRGDLLKDIKSVAFIVPTLPTPLSGLSSSSQRFITAVSGMVGVWPDALSRWASSLEVTTVGLSFGLDGSLLSVSSDETGGGSYVARLPKRYDAVIASVGGEPLDQTLMLSINALLLSSRVIKGSGTVILVTECEKGIGSEKLLRYLLTSEVDDESSYHYLMATSVKGVRENYHVGMVTPLPKSYVEGVCGFRSFDTIQDSVHYITRLHGKGLSVCLIPHGYVTDPLIEE
ncbi:MAG: hypothetical protein NZ920_03500 [Aigarchaeota archaeon]|nr:hypothetical protein [Aigarchaeota archaeon]